MTMVVFVCLSWHLRWGNALNHKLEVGERRSLASHYTSATYVRGGHARIRQHQYGHVWMVIDRSISGPAGAGRTMPRVGRDCDESSPGTRQSESRHKTPRLCPGRLSAAIIHRPVPSTPTRMPTSHLPVNSSGITQLRRRRTADMFTDNMRRGDANSGLGGCL